jgi:hypothetical protein
MNVSKHRSAVALAAGLLGFGVTWVALPSAQAAPSTRSFEVRQDCQIQGAPQSFQANSITSHGNFVAFSEGCYSGPA